jgi:hypothetical protein
MSRNPHRGASEALFIASICLSAMTGASAQQRPHLASGRSHDGVYTVDIFTSGGNCDKAFQWAIIVTQGQIICPQGAYMEASGEISPGGLVSLEFRRDSQVATVVGRVSNKAGFGTWSSPTLRCVGTWTAVCQAAPAGVPNVVVIPLKRSP